SAPLGRGRLAAASGGRLRRGLRLLGVAEEVGVVLRGVLLAVSGAGSSPGGLGRARALLVALRCLLGLRGLGAALHEGLVDVDALGDVLTGREEVPPGHHDADEVGSDLAHAVLLFRSGAGRGPEAPPPPTAPGLVRRAPRPPSTARPFARPARA